MILRHYLEGAIIFVLLTVNAVIGHMHSRGSQKAVELLKKKLAIKARVLRDGKWVIKEAKEIVPGDIIAIGLIFSAVFTLGIDLPKFYIFRRFKL